MGPSSTRMYGRRLTAQGSGPHGWDLVTAWPKSSSSSRRRILSRRWPTRVEDVRQRALSCPPQDERHPRRSCAMSNLVHNEQVKLAATFWNNLAIAALL